MTRADRLALSWAWWSAGVSAGWLLPLPWPAWYAVSVACYVVQYRHLWQYWRLVR